jgi:hypothetical protein
LLRSLVAVEEGRAARFVLMKRPSQLDHGACRVARAREGRGARDVLGLAGAREGEAVAVRVVFGGRDLRVFLGGGGGGVAGALEGERLREGWSVHGGGGATKRPGLSRREPTAPHVGTEEHTLLTTGQASGAAMRPPAPPPTPRRLAAAPEPNCCLVLSQHAAPNASAAKRPAPMPTQEGPEQGVGKLLAPTSKPT